jgi:tRNA threonylcarbamoyladenosine biosynthesis protein TsaB
MAVVALETSARSASIAVRVGDRELAAHLDPARAHASDILPALARSLGELGASPADIETVLVGTGPGSYTGLRVGIATALGLVRGAGARILGVPSGETLVFGALPPGGEGVYLLDARQGELYFAVYRRTDDDVVTLCEPCVLTAAELPRHLPPNSPILGDESVARAAALGAEDMARLRTDRVPEATALLRLGLTRLERSGAHRPRDVSPLYLRPFAATARRR